MFSYEYIYIFKSFDTFSNHHNITGRPSGTLSYTAPSTMAGNFVLAHIPLTLSCNFSLLLSLLLRGTIVNRTYGTHKNLYNSLFLLTKFGPIYYGPP